MSVIYKRSLEVDPKSNKFSVTVHQHNPMGELLVSDKIFFMVAKKI